jgi:hypothetical protein
VSLAVMLPFVNLKRAGTMVTACAVPGHCLCYTGRSKHALRLAFDGRKMACSLKVKVQSCPCTKFDIQRALTHTAGGFAPRLSGITKLMAELTKHGQWQKALLVFDSIPALGLEFDATAANAALGACAKGGSAECARNILSLMHTLRLQRDAISRRCAINAFCQAGVWPSAIEVCIAAALAIAHMVMRAHE